ncbi:hypothetical protein HOD29_02560 [archaeon]|jgi:hypothetical protein|nr:hypothetical protein [archaeon]
MKKSSKYLVIYFLLEAIGAFSLFLIISSASSWFGFEATWKSWLLIPSTLLFYGMYGVLIQMAILHPKQLIRGKRKPRKETRRYLNNWFIIIMLLMGSICYECFPTLNGITTYWWIYMFPLTFLGLIHLRIKFQYPFYEAVINRHGWVKRYGNKY